MSARTELLQAVADLKAVVSRLVAQSTDEVVVQQAADDIESQVADLKALVASPVTTSTSTSTSTSTGTTTSTSTSTSTTTLVPGQPAPGLV
jgi:predicted RNA-binding Zn ribbon-like protein